MNYYSNDIRHIRGDTFSCAFIIEDFEQNLDTVYFTCKDGLNDDSEILFSKSLDNGISLIENDETLNIKKYSVRVSPEDTADLQSGTYYYNLKIGVNGDIFTIMQGKFIIQQDCTEGGN